MGTHLSVLSLDVRRYKKFGHELFRFLFVLGLGSAASASVLPVVEYHKAKALQILFEGGGLACVELPRDASTLDDFERAAVEGRLKRLLIHRCGDLPTERFGVQRGS